MRIDFAYTPLADGPAQRAPWRGWSRTLLATGIALCASAWLLAQTLAPLPRDDVAEAGLAEPVAPVVPPPSEDTELQTLFAFDWPGVFALLERSLPDDVELIALDVQARGERLKLVARSGTAGEALAYLQQLQSRSALGGLRITQQEREGGSADPAGGGAWLVTIEGPIARRAAAP